MISFKKVYQLVTNFYFNSDVINESLFKKIIKIIFIDYKWLGICWLLFISTVLLSIYFEINSIISSTLFCIYIYLFIYKTPMFVHRQVMFGLPDSLEKELILKAYGNAWTPEYLTVLKFLQNLSMKDTYILLDIVNKNEFKNYIRLEDKLSKETISKHFKSHLITFVKLIGFIVIITFSLYTYKTIGLFFNLTTMVAITFTLGITLYGYMFYFIGVVLDIGAFKQVLKRLDKINNFDKDLFTEYLKKKLHSQYL